MRNLRNRLKRLEQHQSARSDQYITFWDLLSGSQDNYTFEQMSPTDQELWDEIIRDAQVPKTYDPDVRLALGLEDNTDE